MTNRKWKEIKQQPSMLPVPAVPGSCLVSFHFLWVILSTSTVYLKILMLLTVKFSRKGTCQRGSAGNEDPLNEEAAEPTKKQQQPLTLWQFATAAIAIREQLTRVIRIIQRRIF